MAFRRIGELVVVIFTFYIYFEKYNNLFRKPISYSHYSYFNV